MEDYIVAYETITPDWDDEGRSIMIARFVVAAESREDAQLQAERLRAKVLGEHREANRENAVDEDAEIAVTVTPVRVFVDRLIQRRTEIEAWEPAEADTTPA